MKSGFVTLVGRPNVGKSTLLNQILGQKVTIVSDKPQTTRTQVRGVLTRPDAQVVFVDTPGIHKPRTLLGERLNETATGSIGDVDVVTTHNPFAVNDLWFSARTGFPLERMNPYGSSLVYGHPQGPTGVRAITELAHALHARGGGVGLFTGCAAGDSAGAVVLRVDG